MSKKRTFRLFGIIALAVVILAGGAFAVSQKMSGGKADSASADSTAAGDTAEKMEKEAPKVPVEITEARPRDLPATFATTGSLEAKRQVELVAKAQGQVTRLLVEEGDQVKEGDVLAELDPREEKILFEQAEVSVETAQREYERLKSLAAHDLTSAKDLDAAAERAERAVYDRDLAQVRLDDKIIRAPFSGQVTVRHIDLGQTVAPGGRLFGLADTSPLEVTLFLPEEVVKDLEPGQPVQITPDVDPDAVLEGTVDRIAPVVDPATSTVKVTLHVADDAGRARVGSFVRARITTDVRHDVLAVPKKSLVAEAGATYLFVAEADSVRKVAVQTGYTDDDFVEIIDGLAIGERVVTVGQGGLRTGSRIRDLAAERDSSSSSGPQHATAGEDDSTEVVQNHED